MLKTPYKNVGFLKFRWGRTAAGGDPPLGEPQVI